MPHKRLDKQKVYFFTGKGGVGKSLLALSKALYLAENKGSTLYVELAGSQEPFEEEQLLKHKDISYYYLDPLEELKLLFEHYFKSKKVAHFFFENKIMKTLVGAAPGLKELAILGKLTSKNRDFGPSFDQSHIVVDGYSTGHFLNLLSVPIGLSEVIKKGPMGQQTKGITLAIKNNVETNYYVVVSADETPLNEGLELAKKIKELTGVSPKFIFNKYLDLKKPYSSYCQNKISNQKKMIKKMKDKDYKRANYTFLSSLLGRASELSRIWLSLIHI